MSLFGGSKSTTNTTIDERNFTNVDNRITDADTAFVGGNQSVQAGDNSTVNLTTTDYGALDAASQLSDRSLNLASGAFNAALGANQQAVKAAVDVAERASTDEAARTTQLLIVGGALVLIVGAFFAFKKRL